MEVGPGEIEMVIDSWELGLDMLLPILGSLTSPSVVSGRTCFEAFMCDIN